MASKSIIPCPDCGKIISLRFPVHDCAGPRPVSNVVEFKRRGSRSWGGNGFGSGGCDYDVVMGWKRMGRIESIDRGTWRLTLDGAGHWMYGRLADAKKAAEQKLHAP